MEKKKVVIALGHRALGNTLPEQKEATKELQNHCAAGKRGRRGRDFSQ